MQLAATDSGANRAAQIVVRVNSDLFAEYGILNSLRIQGRQVDSQILEVFPRA
jgi:hypothetical protein